MAEELWNDLRETIDRHHAAVFVGAGASMQASGDSNASWEGLLRHGLRRCQDTGMLSGTVKAWSALLVNGEFLAVADAVTEYLGGAEGGEFGRWLEQRIGAFELKDRRLPDALGALQAPLLTTNYDTLLEKATGRRTFTWKDGARWQLVQRDPAAGILHLHGSYEVPETVVLGARSYDSVLRDPSAQNALRALASTRNLVFVGFGAGIADPNFTALRKFLSTVLRSSQFRHFRLVRDEDVDEARKQHAREENIHVLGHGPGYGSLAARLEDLAPEARELPVSVPTPRFRRRPQFEIEICSTEVKARIPGQEPVTGPLLLDEVHVETVLLLDEWLRFQEDPSNPNQTNRSRKSDVATVLGRILFDAVFTGKVRDLYRELFRAATLDEPLSLMLKVCPGALNRIGRIESLNLTSIPWELMCDRETVLSTSRKLTLSRVPSGDPDTSPWEAPNDLSVLVVVAQPKDLVQPLREEWDAAHAEERYDTIVEKIVDTVREIGPKPTTIGTVGSSKRATGVNVKSALNPEDPTKGPQIVHYIGHARGGKQGDKLAFVQENSNAPDWQPFEGFAKCFDVDRAPILVFLHLCQGSRSLTPDDVDELAWGNFSPLAFRLIERQVRIVVAMQYPAAADLGREFTECFYSNLKTKTVAKAVQEARKTVQESSVGGLVLYLRGEDGAILPQDEPTTDRGGTNTTTTRTDAPDKAGKSLKGPGGGSPPGDGYLEWTPPSPLQLQPEPAVKLPPKQQAVTRDGKVLNVP